MQIYTYIVIIQEMNNYIAFSSFFGQRTLMHFMTSFTKLVLWAAALELFFLKHSKGAWNPTYKQEAGQ